MIGPAGSASCSFARTQPDTPGKLAAHAYSFEHLEIAAYELLARVASVAGDQETADVARRIQEDERRMADRLARRLRPRRRGLTPRALGAAALDERAWSSTLRTRTRSRRRRSNCSKKAPEIGGDAERERVYREHLEETREHQRLVRERLEAHGSGPSALKDAAMRLGALNWGTVLPGPSRHPGQAGGVRLRLRAPRDRRLSGAQAGRSARRRRGDGRGRGSHPRPGASGRPQDRGGLRTRGRRIAAHSGRLGLRRIARSVTHFRERPQHRATSFPGSGHEAGPAQATAGRSSASADHLGHGARGVAQCVQPCRCVTPVRPLEQSSKARRVRPRALTAVRPTPRSQAFDLATRSVLVRLPVEVVSRPRDPDAGLRRPARNGSIQTSSPACGGSRPAVLGRTNPDFPRHLGDIR